MDPNDFIKSRFDSRPTPDGDATVEPLRDVIVRLKAAYDTVRGLLDDDAMRALGIDVDAGYEIPLTMSIRLAYEMGYADALAKRLPDSSMAESILSDGAGE